LNCRDWLCGTDVEYKRYWSRIKKKA